MPFFAWQVRCAEVENAIKKQKIQFDRRGPHYPFRAEVYGADGALIASQKFDTPFSRPKIEVETGGDWDVPITLKYYDAHVFILSEEIHWVVVETIESSGVQRIPGISK